MYLYHTYETKFNKQHRQSNTNLKWSQNLFILTNWVTLIIGLLNTLSNIWKAKSQTCRNFINKFNNKVTAKIKLVKSNCFKHLLTSISINWAVPLQFVVAVPRILLLQRGYWTRYWKTFEWSRSFNFVQRLNVKFNGPELAQSVHGP